MIIPDVNLLLYATITGFEHHRRAHQWWQDSLNGSEPIGMAPAVIFGFVRISTNGRVLTEPLSVSQATGYMERWLKQPPVRLLTSDDDHVRETLRIIEGIGTAANLTTDAQIAAHAYQHRGTVYSNDADFGRFDNLPWTNPLRT